MGAGIYRRLEHCLRRSREAGMIGVPPDASKEGLASFVHIVYIVM
jgi:hypothetical protein